MASTKYFGKYRAVVTDVNDPEKRGRIRVQCPSVLKDAKSAWCEVCSPVAYDGGGDFCLPKVGEAVWVEFEEGSPNKPIWVGGWWSINKTPVPNYSDSPNVRVIEFNGSIIEFKKGELLISAGGSTILLKNGNVFINGKSID